MPAIFDSQGNSFVFAGSSYAATNVTVSAGGDLLDTSNLAIASGSSRTYVSPALKDNEITVDYYGAGVIAIGTSGTLTFGGTTYTAVVSDGSITYAVGELVKGNATFKV
jgi:hypothetical protein